MKIEKVKFGITPSGKEITKYILSNDQGASVAILNYGGIVQAWTVEDKNRNWKDVVLGFDSLEPYLKNPSFFGAIIGRFANRISKGTFVLDGKTYQLPINDSPNSLHGGKEGFDKKVWEVKSTSTNDQSAIIKLHYLSKDGEEGYPGNLDVEVTYTFNNDNALRIDYTATTDKKTIINLTNHSYFNFSDTDSILSHEVMVNADKLVAVNEVAIPTGELLDINNTPLDFRQLSVIGKRIKEDHRQINNVKGYDHCYVLNTNGNLNQLAATAYDPESGFKLEVFTTEPGVHFYSGNFISELTGKDGKHYTKRSGLCFETEHYPDSPNHPEFPSVVLEPEKQFHSTTIFRISHRS